MKTTASTFVSDLARVWSSHDFAGELRDYAAELKGATAGRGRYELEFSHYEPVPPPVQKQLIEAYKPRHDED